MSLMVSRFEGAEILTAGTDGFQVHKLNIAKTNEICSICERVLVQFRERERLVTNMLRGREQNPSSTAIPSLPALKACIAEYKFIAEQFTPMTSNLEKYKGLVDILHKDFDHCIDLYNERVKAAAGEISQENEGKVVAWRVIGPALRQIHDQFQHG